MLHVSGRGDGSVGEGADWPLGLELEAPVGIRAHSEFIPLVWEDWGHLEPDTKRCQQLEFSFCFIREYPQSPSSLCVTTWVCLSVIKQPVSWLPFWQQDGYFKDVLLRSIILKEHVKVSHLSAAAFFCSWLISRDERINGSCLPPSPSVADSCYEKGNFYHLGKHLWCHSWPKWIGGQEKSGFAYEAVMGRRENRFLKQSLHGDLRGAHTWWWRSVLSWVSEVPPNGVDLTERQYRGQIIL